MDAQNCAAFGYKFYENRDKLNKIKYKNNLN